jgi:uncharacterized protein YjbI with pentapeptide repeats
MRQVELLDCRALGLRLSVDLGQDVYVEGGRFDSATLRISRVRGLVVFDGCTFTEAMIGGDLSAVVFTGCTFEGAEFAATAAAGCDLRESRLGGARGPGHPARRPRHRRPDRHHRPRWPPSSGLTVEAD